jgi:predicted Zn-dependent peptidase
MALSKIENYLDEELLMDQTESGLTFILNPKPDFSKTMGILGVRFGSTDNNFSKDGNGLEVPAGTAHFLEHKLFEGEEGDVSDRFAALGASCNAGTGFTSTSYLFSCTDRISENLRLLLDFVQRPYFTPELIKKEQGIIGQEIKMYEDDPDWVVFFNLMKCMYRDHPVNQNIAGSIESIGRINPDLLLSCYRAYYRPGNMALVVVGKMEVDRVVQIIHDDAKIRAPDAKGLDKRYIVEPDPLPQSLSISHPMMVARPKVLIGFKDYDLCPDGAHLQAKEIITQMVIDIILGKSSENYERLYGDGVIDDSFSAYYSGYMDFGFTSIGCDTDEPDRFMERTQKILEEVARKGIDQTDFERQKNKYLGKFIRIFNSVEGTAVSLLNFFIKGVTPSRVIDIIQGITREDLNVRLQRHLEVKQMVLSVIEPISSSNRS